MWDGDLIPKLATKKLCNYAVQDHVLNKYND